MVIVEYYPDGFFPKVKSDFWNLFLNNPNLQRLFLYKWDVKCPTNCSVNIKSSEDPKKKDWCLNLVFEGDLWTDKF